MEVLAENRIGRKILRHIQSLAYPRFPGTNGELRAQEYIRTSFQTESYLVTEQDFVSSLFPLELFPRMGIALISTFLVAALTFVRAIPALSIELGILTLLILLAGTRWTRMIERMYAFKRFGQVRSKNIIAVHPLQDQHLNIMFTAHYDSKSQTFSGPLRFFLFGAFGILAVVSAVLAVISAMTGFPQEILLFAVVPACLIALILQINTTRNASPGAYDNASGVGILLELARSFNGEIPNANLIFVATGAEEAGLCGAVALMQDDRFIEQFPPERTIILNLDGLGSKGPIRITDRHGIPPVKTGALVGNLCREVARRFGLETKSVWLPTGALMDHIPFASHGYQTVTISTAGWNKAFRSMHTKGDTPGHLDVATLEYCYALCQEIVDSMPSIERQRN